MVLLAASPLALLLVVLLAAMPLHIFIVTTGELRKRHIQLVGVKARPASEQIHYKNCYTTDYIIAQQDQNETRTQSLYLQGSVAMKSHTIRLMKHSYLSGKPVRPRVVRREVNEKNFGNEMRRVVRVFKTGK